MNLFRLSALIVKELLSYLRDPKSRMTLIGPPIMQLLIFSFAATLEVKNVDVAIFDRDHGAWSEELTARIRASSFIDDLLPVKSPDELRRLVDTGKVLMAVELPDDFSRNLTAGRPAKAQVIVDGRRANAGQIAARYLSDIAARMNQDLSFELGSIRGTPAYGGGVPPPEVSVRHWFNPNLVYRWFIVPGLVGILAMLLSLLVTGLSIARERELGTFDQLLVSPVTPLEIVVGKTVPALIVGGVMGNVMIAAGVFALRVPFTGSLWLLEVSLILFIFSVVGIGLMLSSVCKTQQQAILGVFSIMVPVILVSGFATPLENMPGWLQTVAQANPLKHFLIIVQGTFLRAQPAADVLANAWPLAVIALCTLTLANLIVQRRLQ